MIIKKRTRKFKVNFDLKISDRGDISLSENEMINLITKEKKMKLSPKNGDFI